MSQFKKFEGVITIANEGGFSGAAQKLQISQPTLSKYIKKLESEIGLELFDRTSIPIRLTKAGECYAEAGKRLIDLETQLEKQLAEIKSKKNSVIRIGVSPSRSPYLIPKLIEKYRDMNPDAKVIVEEKTTDELAERLSDGDVDIIISLLDEQTDQFEKIELFSEDIILASPKKLDTGALSARELMLSYPIISVGKGQAMRHTLSEISSAIGAPMPEIECQSIESGLALVKSGLGIMLAPSYVEKFGSSEQKEKIRFAKFEKSISAQFERTVCLFYRKEQFLTKAERDFLSCVESFIKE